MDTEYTVKQGIEVGGKRTVVLADVSVQLLAGEDAYRHVQLSAVID
jgi:hypothetical protein